MAGDEGDHGIDRRVPQDVRALLMAAADEAMSAGSASVEAPHLLLALSARPGPVGRELVRAGLDRAGVEAALRSEREASLRSAGVTPPPAERMRATPSRIRPRFGTTTREALQSGHHIIARLEAGHRAGRSAGRMLRRDPDRIVALGVLDARLGTVPRALALAGIDREELAARIRAL